MARCVRVLMHFYTERPRRSFTTSTSRAPGVSAMTSPSDVAGMADLADPGRAQVTGLGLVGTSIALALRARGWHVTGHDLDETRAKRAHELGAVDELGVDHLAGVAFVATPVSAIAGEVTSLLARRPVR